MRSEELRIKCAPYNYGLYLNDAYDREVAFGPNGWYYSDCDRSDDVDYNPESDRYEDYIDDFIEYVACHVPFEKKYLIWFIKEFVVLDYILNKLDDEHMAFLEKYGFAIKSDHICRPPFSCYKYGNTVACEYFEQCKHKKIVNKYIL